MVDFLHTLLITVLDQNSPTLRPVLDWGAVLLSGVCGVWLTMLLGHFRPSALPPLATPSLTLAGPIQPQQSVAPKPFNDGLSHWDYDVERRPDILERLFLFAAIWSEQYLLIVGWLIFKLGLRWLAWQAVLRAGPGALGFNPLDELQVRYDLGIRQVFWVTATTLHNILCGWLGAGLARILLDVLTAMAAGSTT